MNEDRWIDVNEAEHAGERAALDYLKANLPTAEPYRAWASFELPHRDQFAQVDCLVVGPRAIFLIEIKSYRGELLGDSMEWRKPTPHLTRTEANPLIWANMKARWLKGALERSSTFKKKGARSVPRVQALIFLAGGDFVCRLDEDARAGIGGFDADLTPQGVSQGGGLDGILSMIRRYERGSPVNAELSTMVAQAIDEIGIRPSLKYAQVGNAVIDEEIMRNSHAVYCSAHDAFVPANCFSITFHKPVGTVSGGKERAERAALREYELLSSSEMHHPGLPTAVGVDPDHPRGPAVVFDVDPTARPLDEFLEQNVADMTETTRLDLVRRLGEALEYAHGRRMFHRALKPSAVMVTRSSSGHWQPVITDWATGLRAEALEGGPGAVRGTTHVTNDDDEALRYQAPEVIDAAEPSLSSADIFSLGALAYLILSGTPPPEAQAEALKTGGGHLDLAAADPSLTKDLRDLVGFATEEDPDKRTESVKEFLGLLDCIAAEGGSPPVVPATAAANTAASQTPAALDPSRVQPGLKLGEFEIISRLSEGSSGVAAVAIRSESQRGVLKISTSEDNDSRIDAEAQALGRVRSRTVIGLLDGPIRLGGRSAIFLDEANGGTLRDRLREGGPQAVDDVSRWGKDMVGALEDLEAFGVFHRDIKPENVGLKELPDGYQAILLDLSLASAPIDDLNVGTAPYRDPFLGDRAEKIYDGAADRYAAAMVLHELLTGEVPQWGDGTKAPRLCELKLKDDALPTEASTQLSTFFGRALAKDYTARFDSAREMLRAWEDAFSADAGQPASVGTGTEIFIDLDGTRVTATFSMASRNFNAMLAQIKTIPAPDRRYDAPGTRWMIRPTDEAAAVLRRMCASYRFAVSDEAIAVLKQAETDTTAAEPAETAVDVGGAQAVEPLPALIIDGMGRTRLKISFRKRIGEVTEQEVEALKARLAVVPSAERFIAPRRQWHLTPTPQSAALIMELASERECRIRPGAKLLIDTLINQRPDAREELTRAAGPKGEADGVVLGGGPQITLGEFELRDTGKLEASTGVPAGADEPTSCVQHLYELEGPDGILLAIVDEKFDNGDRYIRVKDAYGSAPRFEELTGRLRLSVMEKKDSEDALRVDLSQARIADPVLNEDRGGMYLATAEQLDAGAGADVAQALMSLGATSVGTREALLGDTSPRQGRLCAIFPSDAEHVPVAAYVMIRVAPIWKRLPR